MTEHLEFETLCDLADGALDAETTARARAHVHECAECEEQLTSLRALAAHAGGLPKGIAPPPDLWADIRQQIAPRATTRGIGGWTRSAGWLAAAAIMIAVLSSGATFLLMRTEPAAAIATSTGTPSVPTLQARHAFTEVRYTRDVEILLRTLSERRDSLAPSTVQTIERSLRVADSAIAEARAALTQDPHNTALAALFASNYERKIDLLKRATELTPRT